MSLGQRVVLLVLTSVGWMSAAYAQRPERRDAPVPRQRGVTERQALAFAEKHYAELAEVLRVLRRSQPQRYREAMRQLTRTVRQLEAIHRRDPRRYELELAVWKAEMKVKLLAARLGMSPETALERQLEEAVRQQLLARLALQRYLCERLEARLRELQQEVQRLERTLDQEVQRRVRRLKGAVHRARSVRRSSRARRTHAAGASRSRRTTANANVPKRTKTQGEER